MRRSSAKTQAAGFSLFPFLAVLLCTMGALIVVLVVIARAARLRTAAAAPNEGALLEDIHAQRAALEWRGKHLQTSRDKTKAQLRDRLLELSHVEEHSRRLRRELAELEAAPASLAGSPRADDAALAQELATLRQNIAAVEHDLRRKRDDAAARQPSYAIIPYDGPNQTSRRPIYVECRKNEIVFQPEGIVLTPDDFAGPLGPSNPLAAGLRAAREFLVRNRNNELGEPGEPYPLLLVRPDGIDAYYAAREAMMSWGSEFGYELIEQDWKLEFNEASPGLAEAARLAVEEARIRQHQLALAAPRYSARPEYYRATPGRGGLVRDRGPHEDQDGTGGGSQRRPPGWATNRPQGSGFGATGRGGNRPRSRAGDAAGDGPATAEAVSAGRAGRSGSGTGNGEQTAQDAGRRGEGSGRAGSALGDKQPSPAGWDGGPYAAALAAGNDRSLAASNATPDQIAGAATDPADATGDRGHGGTAKIAGGKSPGDGTDDAGPDGADSTDAAGSPASRQAAAGRATSKLAEGAAAPRGGAGAAAGAVGVSAGGATPSASPSNPGGTPSLNVSAGGQATKSLAEARGRNWGLPDAAYSAVPITRPVRVECSADKLLLTSEDGARNRQREIPLPERTEESIEELVSAVWEHIDTWGPAGRGMYWRPTLAVEVMPDGAGRFADLQTLLADSGLDVQPSPPKAPTAQAKPKRGRR